MANTGRTYFKKGQIPWNKIGEDQFCLFCNKQFHVRPAKIKVGKGKYCSKKCFILAKSNPKILTICKICKKEFKAWSSLKKIFCSDKCMRIGSRTAITKKCGNVNCNNTIYVFQSNLKRGNGKYCSQQCFAYTLIPTTIEKILYAYLDEKNIKYEKQKQIRFYLLDAYIPSLNLVIEADGVYWHSLPKVIRIDRAKNSYLKNRGYNLIRLTEAQLHSGEFKKLLPF